MQISTTIYIEPTPKARPRFGISKGGRRYAYTPKKTADAEYMIRQSLLDLGFFGEGIPLRLEATFYRQRPKSLPKRVILPVKAPDLDNYVKTLEDAMEKFVYLNDSQITAMLVKKRFGSPPRIELKLEVDK